MRRAVLDLSFKTKKLRKAVKKNNQNETLTLIRTGFRNPARTNSSTLSVCVAENNPVRRCFGKNLRIEVIVA
jgi:hypothetical protein